MIRLNPPLPPNWNAHLDDTIAARVPYKLFPIPANTLEHNTLSDLLNPFQITTAEQVVNPNLWSRFISTRKFMLQSKSDDGKNVQLAACPYNDNLALLFHCTKSSQNVDNILLRGLDERLGNPNGTLGRGIYFADDPKKAVQYDSCSTIFVFMVLLGDCLCVDQSNNSFVREPEKQGVQQRNFSDIHFDSIVGYLNKDRHSEYMVFNRYQCCPLYKIRYQGNSYYHRRINYNSSNKLLPFCWRPDATGTIPMPKPTTNSNWPLNATLIFEKMGVKQVAEDVVPETKERAESIEYKLTVLLTLGFMDAELNIKTLKKYSYDLDKSVNHLLELVEMNEQLSETEILNNNKLAYLSSLGLEDVEMNRKILEKNSYDLNRCIENLEELRTPFDLPREFRILDESEESIKNKLAMLSSLGFTDTQLNIETLKKNSFDLDECVNQLLNEGAKDQLSESEKNKKCAYLLNLGFLDIATNSEVLTKCSYNVAKTINYLLEMGLENDHRSESRYKFAMESTHHQTNSSPKAPQSENCVICCISIDMTPTNWQVLQCNHKVCISCYSRITITRTTMAGVSQTFLRCPLCMKTSGIEIGTCPNGVMTTKFISNSCAGYEGYNTICINYKVNDTQYKLNRTAFLPNNDEGNEVLKLLRIAWDRRLCFSIGTSFTTGQQNTLVWNIHHKSLSHGGIERHGFPDETYLQRVKLELKAHGIE